MVFASSLKFFTGLVVLISGTSLFYMQFYTSSRLFIVSAKVVYAGDALSETIQLENIIRNVSEAEVESIGTVYSDCKLKDVKTGLVLLREFGNQTREVWIIVQLNPDRMIESGLIKVRLFLNSAKLYVTHFDLCKKFLPAIKCPLYPQRQTYGLRYALPHLDVTGKYGIEVWAVDQTDQTIACVTAEYSL